MEKGKNLTDIVTYVSLKNEAPTFSKEVHEVLDYIRHRAGVGQSLEELMDTLWNKTKAILPHDRIGLSFIENDGQRVTSHYSRTEYEPSTVQLGKDYSAGLANSTLKGILDKELALIKEFSTGKERTRFIEEILYEVLKGDQSLAEYLYFAFSLYRGDVNNIIEKEGVNMTIVEKNIEAWNEQLGLKDKYKKEGIKEGKIEDAKTMIKKEYNIEEICDITGLGKEKVEKLKEEMGM